MNYLLKRYIVTSSFCAPLIGSARCALQTLPCFCRCILNRFTVSSFVIALPKWAELMLWNWSQFSGLASGILWWQSADRDQDTGALLSDKYIHRCIKLAEMATNPLKLKTVITANERWVAVRCADCQRDRGMRKEMCTLLFLILVIPHRLLNLKNTFETKYGESPLFYAYAPGRVNLIGNILSFF